MTQQEQINNKLTLTLVLNERQSQLIERLAQQMGVSPEEAALTTISDRLEQLGRQGPGLTAQEMTEAIEESKLAEIVVATRHWHPAYAGPFPDLGDPEPERNQHGEILLAEVNFACRRDAGTPFSHAGFVQDSNPPHYWRAWLEPIAEEDGEIGDLPEDAFPHPTVRDAANALATACRERFPQPAGLSK